MRESPAGFVRQVLQPVMLVALVACGASGPRGSDDAAEPNVAAPGLVEAPNVVAQASSEGNSAVDADDEAAGDDARSFVNVWRFLDRSMSTRFVHYFDPRSGPSGSVSLMYGARGRGGLSMQLEWPYDGSEVRYSYDDLTVAPSYVGFREEPANREWRAVAGQVALLPLADGRVRVELGGLEIVESLAQGEGAPEPIGDGFVVGEVDRVCIEYAVPTENAPIDGSTGQPAPQPQRDDDWSSPFCSQFAR